MILDINKFNTLDFFRNNKKKDDLSDSFLQSLCYICFKLELRVKK